MKVLFCGDRNWTDEACIARVMAQLPSGTTVIHGGAYGADTIAGRVAERMGFKVKVFRPDWKRYGRGAGPIRNAAMLKERPDIVFAFHNDLNKSKGTANMVGQAEAGGFEVVVYASSDNDLEGR